MGSAAVDSFFQRESSLLTNFWSESASSPWWSGGPASRHGSLNCLFQVALHLLSYVRFKSPIAWRPGVLLQISLLPGISEDQVEQSEEVSSRVIVWEGDAILSSNPCQRYHKTLDGRQNDRNSLIFWIPRPGLESGQPKLSRGEMCPVHTKKHGTPDHDMWVVQCAENAWCWRWLFGSQTAISDTPRKVNITLPRKGKSNSHGARPVFKNHLDD